MNGNHDHDYFEVSSVVWWRVKTVGLIHLTWLNWHVWCLAGPERYNWGRWLRTGSFLLWWWWLVETPFLLNLLKQASNSVQSSASLSQNGKPWVTTEWPLLYSYSPLGIAGAWHFPCCFCCCRLGPWWTPKKCIFQKKCISPRSLALYFFYWISSSS